MTLFDAWHLPGLRMESLQLRERAFGQLRARVPDLTTQQVQTVIERICHARADALRARPVLEIAQLIAAASQKINTAETRQLLHAATGYSRETIEDVLTHMMHDWSEPSLRDLLQSELGDPTVLDKPVRNMTGPELAFHVFAGNVPGVAVTSIIRSLLVKSATFGKTASDEPVLPVLFARALAAVAPEIGECLAVTYWPGGTTALEEAVLSRADAVIVYGGTAAVKSVSARSGAARLIVHGPRLSLGIVSRDAALAVAGPIARAVAAYDQQGCVSPHVVFVEKGGALGARDLARAIGSELADLAQTLPRRAISAGEAIAIRDARAKAEFSASDVVEVFGPDDLSYTVIYDDVVEMPTSCLNRTIYVRAIATAHDIPALLKPHEEFIQSVALEGFAGSDKEALASELAASGATRITDFENLPWPPMSWQHDGRGPLQELLSCPNPEIHPAS